MIFYKFTEHNDWEGETWHFFFPEDPDAYNQMLELLESYPEDWDCPYVLSDKEYTEAKVDLMVSEARDGYYDSHNKMKGVRRLPKVVDWGYGDPFYKGGIFK